MLAVSVALCWIVKSPESFSASNEKSKRRQCSPFLISHSALAKNVLVSPSSCQVFLKVTANVYSDNLTYLVAHNSRSCAVIDFFAAVNGE